MAGKVVQETSDIYSSSDAIRFFKYKKAEGLIDLDIKKIGETQYEISRNGIGKITLNDNSRTLPKNQRQYLLFLIFCLIGITGGVILYFTYPYWSPIWESMRLMSFVFLQFS